MSRGRKAKRKAKTAAHCKAHARKRLRQRFGIELGHTAMHDLIRRVRENDPNSVEHLSRLSWSRSLKRVLVEDKWVNVIYDHKRHSIVTALTDEQVPREIAMAKFEQLEQDSRAE